MNYTHFTSLIDSKSWNLCSLYVSTICHDKSQVNPLLIFFFFSCEDWCNCSERHHRSSLDQSWFLLSHPLYWRGGFTLKGGRGAEELINLNDWVSTQRSCEWVQSSTVQTHTHTKRHGNWKRHKQKRWPRSRLHLHGGRSSSTTLIFEAKQWDDFENMNFCPKIMNNK